MGTVGDETSWQDYLHSAQDALIPLSVHWDLTYRCDHKCVHCYRTDRKREELSLEEAINLLDSLAEAGTISLLLSGGDLFLRPDAIDILREARLRNFDVRINTHGNFIDEELADEIAAIGLSRVSISVYSANAEAHEAVTLIKGSHKKSLDAARFLVARGVPVNFKTPLTVHNRSCYDSVGPLAKEIGATAETDAHITPDDESDFGLCSIGVHSSERTLALVRDILSKGHDHLPHWYEVSGAPTTARTCAAGTALGYISPDGLVYPCLSWRDPIGDLREQSFLDIWRNSPAAARQREVTRASYLTDCDGCGFNKICNYCPGLSHAEHGDPGRRSSYVCERTHLTVSAMEHAKNLTDAGESAPLPGTDEARDLMRRSTYADRQWAARQAGLSRPADRIRPSLVQIAEPR